MNLESLFVEFSPDIFKMLIQILMDYLKRHETHLLSPLLAYRRYLNYKPANSNYKSGTYLLSDPAALRWFNVSNFNSLISSMAYRNPSRPNPDCLTPPYGMWSMRKVDTSFTIKPPTSMSSKACLTRRKSLVKSPACRPKSLSPTAEMAWRISV